MAPSVHKGSTEKTSFAEPDEQTGIGNLENLNDDCDKQLLRKLWSTDITNQKLKM